MKWFYSVSIALANLTQVFATTASATTPAVQIVSSLGQPAFGNGATRPMRITCLTIGSRGDVQPFIALGLGLQEDGHKVTIATHLEFQHMVEEAGIYFKNIGGDPKELIKHCVEHGIFSPAFYTKGYSKFSGWINDLVTTAAKACEGAEVLIESPTAMMGIHIAESMGIPYFRAFTMPWTPTTQYSHPFAPTPRESSSYYNKMTYTVFDYLVWKGIEIKVNRWRQKTLNLKPTSFSKLHLAQIPYLYNFSEHIVPKPSDWGDKIHVTGYWFQDQQKKSDPKELEEKIPLDLRTFLQEAKKRNKKVVYIGFGSVIFPDAEKVQKKLKQAVIKADIWAVVSGGWSDMHESEKSERIHYINAVPHEWLFFNVDATLTHGGAGTTAASLRAGIPTIIKPFFGDQFFWAKTVKRMGVGSHVHAFRVAELARAFKRATNDPGQIRRAKEIGEVIRRENGVRTAIQKIYQDMDYARDLIKKGFAKDDDPRLPLLKTNDAMGLLGRFVRRNRSNIYYFLMAIIRWYQISSIQEQSKQGSSDTGIMEQKKHSNFSLPVTALKPL